MKKVAYLLLTIGALITVSCGGTRDPEPATKIVDWYELSPTATFDTETPVTIKFWHRMGAAPYGRHFPRHGRHMD
jgi:multiple sugar transport system substrate-binding protein